jgi:hypothetical protein
MMDAKLRKQIADEVRQSMESLNERYVTGKTLCQHIETLTPEWLKKYGSSLNRTKVTDVDTKGVEHESPWVYPLHEIMAKMKDGRMKELRVCCGRNI